MSSSRTEFLVLIREDGERYMFAFTAETIEDLQVALALYVASPELSLTLDEAKALMEKARVCVR